MNIVTGWSSGCSLKYAVVEDDSGKWGEALPTTRYPKKRVDQSFEWNFVVTNCKIDHKSIKGGFDMHSCREQFWSKKTLNFEVWKIFVTFDLNWQWNWLVLTTRKKLAAMQFYFARIFPLPVWERKLSLQTSIFAVVCSNPPFETSAQVQLVPFEACLGAIVLLSPLATISQTLLASHLLQGSS